MYRDLYKMELIQITDPEILLPETGDYVEEDIMGDQ